MLQRQQAQAVVAARTKIVEGAVGMVEMALDHLSQKNIIELDDERRAAMVSNLLVVLCSDRHTQPVVNTGSALHVSQREAFLLRLDPKVLDALRRWAGDDLRSVNAQVEFLLRRALRDAGRLPTAERPEKKKQR